MRKIKDMRWPILVTAETNGPDGKKIKMSRFVDVSGPGSIESAMKLALMSRNDGGDPFLGCEITAVTPAHQIIKRLYDPDTEEIVKI